MMEKACFHSTSGHCLGPAPAQPPASPLPLLPLLSFYSPTSTLSQEQILYSVSPGAQIASATPLPRFCSKAFGSWPFSGSRTNLGFSCPTPPPPQAPQHTYLHLSPFGVDTEGCPAQPPILSSGLQHLPSGPPPSVLVWPGQLPGLRLSSSHFQPLSLVRLHFLARVIQ